MTPLDQIDLAINTAASRITNAKPSDALRANVMSRISSEPAGRLRAWRFGAGFAAIASIGLVAFVSLHNRAIPNPTISTPTLINPTIPTPTLINPTVINGIASANPTIAGNAPSPLASIARTAADDSGRLVFTTDADQAGMSVPALEHPELMTIKPLLEGAPIKAIDFQPIGRVAPLVVPAIGDDNQ